MTAINEQLTEIAERLGDMADQPIGEHTRHDLLVRIYATIRQPDGKHVAATIAAIASDWDGIPENARKHVFGRRIQAAFKKIGDGAMKIAAGNSPGS